MPYCRSAPMPPATTGINTGIQQCSPGTPPLQRTALDPIPRLHRPCAACRFAKVRCDRLMPCTRCSRLEVTCQPPPHVRRGRPPGRLWSRPTTKDKPWSPMVPGLSSGLYYAGSQSCVLPPGLDIHVSQLPNPVATDCTNHGPGTSPSVLPMAAGTATSEQHWFNGGPNACASDPFSQGLQEPALGGSTLFQAALAPAFLPRVKSRIAQAN